MFIQKMKLPMRYKSGISLSSEMPIFYRDGGCFKLGRKITIQPNISKEKIIGVAKDRIVEWTVFSYNTESYITAMKIYEKLPSAREPVFTCSKYLFTKAIENFFYDSHFFRTNGLKSAQMFELENAICCKPAFMSDMDEILFKFDRVSFIESEIERLFVFNKQPLLPVAHDLILKKEVSSDILVDPDVWCYEDMCDNDPVKDAVSGLTVPILQLLASASPSEKQIINQLSPQQSQPPLFQYIGKHANENITDQYQFTYPFDGAELVKNYTFSSEIYQAIDIFDRSFFDHFCVKLSNDPKTPKSAYYGNTYLYSDQTELENCTDFLKTGLNNILQMLYAINKWSNNSFDTITVCKTVTEELFIDLEKNGRHEVFYIDLCIFDLLAHNLIDQ